MDTKQMSKRVNIDAPYRIIVWGPGAIGQACVREILKRPEYELVGVLAYSEAKAGKDIGELMGMAPIGVKVTTDKEAIYAMEADVVLWVGLPFFNMGAMEEEIVRLLESGKNVISSASHHYPFQHGKDYVERLETACRKGNSSLHGTGENPGYWFERMVPTLTGLCTSVESVFLDEYADCAASGSNAETLKGVGFGLSIEEAETTSAFLQNIWKNYYFVESMEMMAQTTWGRPVDRFEIKTGHFLAEQDVVFDRAKGDSITMTIPKGRTLAISHSFTSYIDEQPRLKIRVNWFLGAKNAPFPVAGGDNWRIEIEAQPVSMRCNFDLFASLKGDMHFRPGDHMSPTWYATVVPIIQAIPIVAGAEPGIVVPSVFANCVHDFRLLEKRKSLVDKHSYK